MKISLIVPCYNEAQTVRDFYLSATAVLDKEDFNYEIIYVDDGSHDGTLSILRELSSQDERVKVLSFSRNFGQQAAIIAGFRAATGDAAVELDCDLQDPVEVIPLMVEEWKKGFHVVHGRRISREGENAFKKSTAKGYYKFLSKVSNTQLSENTGDFKLLDRRVLDIICALPEHGKYLRGLESWVGFNQTYVDYERKPRTAGETKYTLKKMVALANDGLLSFSGFPLKISTRLGGLISLLSVVAAVTLLVLTLCDVSIPLVAWIFPFNGLIGGLLLISHGLSNKYLYRVYDEVRARPEYIIQEKINLD